jgi:hypothetical protein
MSESKGNFNFHQLLTSKLELVPFSSEYDIEDIDIQEF